jgi:hypothetical protein
LPPPPLVPRCGLVVQGNKRKRISLLFPETNDSPL